MAIPRMCPHKVAVPHSPLGGPPEEGSLVWEGKPKAGNQEGFTPISALLTICCVTWNMMLFISESQISLWSDDTAFTVLIQKLKISTSRLSTLQPEIKSCLCHLPRPFGIGNLGNRYLFGEATPSHPPLPTPFTLFCSSLLPQHHRLLTS